MNYDKFVKVTGNLAFQLSFIAKCVTTDAVISNPRCWYIHIEPSDKKEGRLLGVASDSKRLHIVDPLDSETKMAGIIPGFWEVLKVGKKVWMARLEKVDNWDYLPWRRIMPSVEPEYRSIFSGISFSGENENTPALVKLLREFPEVTAIHLPYLKDLGTGFDWNMKWYGPNKALQFTEGNRTALIMPSY